MYKRVLGRYRLQQLRTAAKPTQKYLETIENIFYLCDRKNGVSRQTKARSNKKEREKQIDYILNSI